MHWDNVGFGGATGTSCPACSGCAGYYRRGGAGSGCRGMELIAHHPVMNCKWLPVQTVRTDMPQGRILMELIRSGISAICMHTNLDIAEGGVNDCLAQAVGIKRSGAAGRRRMRACRRVAGRKWRWMPFCPMQPGRCIAAGCAMCLQENRSAA